MVPSLFLVRKLENRLTDEALIHFVSLVVQGDCFINPVSSVDESNWKTAENATDNCSSEEQDEVQQATGVVT